MKNKKVLKFVKQFYQAVRKNEKSSGIPWKAALAQAALETGWGVFVKGFNYFGIKAGSKWKGKKQEFKTSEVENGKKIIIKDTFRAYESFQDSLDNYSEFIKDRFSKALETSDPVEFVEVLQNGYSYKYATDPDYVKKIKSIINTIEIALSPLEVKEPEEGGEQPPDAGKPIPKKIQKIKNEET